MNSNGDDHVSFTALDLSVSPSGNHILIATDKDRLILYRTESEVQVPILNIKQLLCCS